MQAFNLKTELASSIKMKRERQRKEKKESTHMFAHSVVSTGPLNDGCDAHLKKREKKKTRSLTNKKKLYEIVDHT